MMHNDILISTQDGESASVRLPDGSVIKMNGESDLIYNNSEYNKSKRNIYFTGSADFIVLNSKNIFTILTDFIKVEVNESKFSLQADRYADESALSLFHGKANVISRVTKQNYMAPQGCKVVVNNRTGRFFLKDIHTGRHNRTLYHSIP